MFRLATTTDAQGFGLTVTDAALTDASGRIQEYLQQDFTYGPQTVEARGERILLPQRPVESVTKVTALYDSVASGLPDSEVLDPALYRLRPGGWLEVPGYTGWLRVDYMVSGDIPDGLVRMTCQIAARIGSQAPELSAGLQQQTAPGFAQTYGWDSYVAASGLTAGERRSLDRIWPRRRGPIIMRTS